MFGFELLINLGDISSLFEIIYVIIFILYQ